LANTNSILPFRGAVSDDALRETIGITQTSNVDENAWYQVQGGLIWQGGRVLALETDTSTVIPFNQPFPKKTLNIQLTVIDTAGSGFATNAEVQGPTLVDFAIGIVTEGGLSEFVDVYWLAVGY